MTKIPVETINGVYMLDEEPTPELLKRLNTPFKLRKFSYKKQTYDYDINDSEAAGVIYPSREREKAVNKAKCDRFNQHFQKLTNTSVCPMKYNDLQESTITTYYMNTSDEERDVLLKREGYKLTGLSRYDRNDICNRILREFVQITKDDLLQENSGDITGKNRELVKQCNVKFFEVTGGLFGLMKPFVYNGLEEPEIEFKNLQDGSYTYLFDSAGMYNFFTREKVKLTPIPAKRRQSYCEKMLLNIAYKIYKEISGNNHKNECWCS